MTESEILAALKVMNMEKAKTVFANRPIVLQMFKDVEENREYSWWHTVDPVIMLYYNTKNTYKDSPIKRSAYLTIRKKIAEENKIFFTKEEFDLLTNYETSCKDALPAIEKMAAAYCLDNIPEAKVSKLNPKHVDSKYLANCMDDLLKKSLVKAIQMNKEKI